MRNGNKKLLSLLLSLTMLVSVFTLGSVSVSAAEVWDGTAATSFLQGGTGTSSDPYKIATAAELKLFANIVNGLGGQESKPESCAVLTADIVLNNGTLSADTDGNPLYNGAAVSNTNKPNEWFPIGYIYDTDGVDDKENVFFKGTFDGQNHTISGLYFNNASQSYVGLFGMAETGVAISNIGIVNSSIIAYGTVGGVCGYNCGTITNCYNTGTVRCVGIYGDIVGGVCGYNYGTITSCFSIGTISSEAVGLIGGLTSAGGVCGYSDSTIINSYYLDTCGAGGAGTSKTVEQFNSGEVTWLLNDEKPDGAWYIKNGLPTLDKTGDIVNLVDGKYVIAKVYTTEVTYSVAPGYTVTIPENVALGENQTITVDAATLAENKQINLALSSGGAQTGFTLQNEAGAEITYTVTKDGSPVAPGDTVLFYNPANAAAVNQTSLLFGEPTAYKHSGHYTGTVTFTVSVGDVPNN